MRVVFLSIATAFVSTAAFAGDVIVTPVSEPGMIGIVAGGVVAAIALARLRK